MKLGRWLGISLYACAVSCYAGWRLEPSVDLQELYSSNIDLNPARMSEWVTEVAPNFQLNNRNSRNPFMAYYRAQGLHYANQTREDKIYHQGLVQFDKTFVRDRFRLVANADHAQTVLFPSSEVTVDNIRGSNTTNVTRALIGPQFNHRLGPKLTTNYQYQMGHILYHKDVPNAQTHDADFELHTYKMAKLTFDSILHWDLTRQDGTTIGETFDGVATVGYFVTKKFRPYVAYGYENHKNQPSFSSLDGPRWHAGFFYQPFKRFFFNGYLGERAFGDSFYVNSTWLRKDGLVSLSYDEEVTNFFRAELSQLPTITVNNLGQVSIQFQPQIRDDVFIRKMARINWQTQSKRWVTLIQPYYERRTIESQDAKEQGAGVNAQVTWIKHPRFQVTMVGGYGHQKLLNQQRDERYQIGITAIQQIKAKTKLQYGVSHFELRRTNLDKIDENMVFVSVTYQPR